MVFMSNILTASKKMRKFQAVLQFYHLGGSGEGVFLEDRGIDLFGHIPKENRSFKFFYSP